MNPVYGIHLDPNSDTILGQQNNNNGQQIPPTTSNDHGLVADNVVGVSTMQFLTSPRHSTLVHGHHINKWQQMVPWKAEFLRTSHVCEVVMQALTLPPCLSPRNNPSVVISDAFAMGRNYFSRPSAEQEDLDDIQERALVLEDMKQCKKLAVDYPSWDPQRHP
jgi:hypothetical protein